MLSHNSDMLNGSPVRCACCRSLAATPAGSGALLALLRAIGAREQDCADLARVLRQPRRGAVDWSGQAPEADAEVPPCLA